MGKNLKKKHPWLENRSSTWLGCLIPIFYRCTYCQQCLPYGVLPGHPPVWAIGSGIPVSFPLDLHRERLSPSARAVCWWVWDENVGGVPCLLRLVTVRPTLSQLTLQRNIPESKLGLLFSRASSHIVSGSRC